MNGCWKSKWSTTARQTNCYSNQLDALLLNIQPVVVQSIRKWRRRRFILKRSRKSLEFPSTFSLSVDGLAAVFLSLSPIWQSNATIETQPVLFWTEINEIVSGKVLELLQVVCTLAQFIFSFHLPLIWSMLIPSQPSLNRIQIDMYYTTSQLAFAALQSLNKLNLLVIGSAKTWKTRRQIL